ncbi:MAG: YeeE/YedE family protein [Sedimentisphaerales bacterium]|nr:YeeE/YedE family protein [Sedimentisphaerales bacterium]
MDDLTVRKAPLPWWLAGLLLGLVQVLAVGINKPLGVSTQFVVVEGVVAKQVMPDYARQHSLLKSEKYQKLGGGFWLDVGLIVGAFVASIVTLRWRPRATTVWWKVNRGRADYLGRFVFGFIGGFLILLGARFAHGCTSGQFASGWAQLSLSVVPFTIMLFGTGMLTAWLVFPRTPEMQR